MRRFLLAFVALLAPVSAFAQTDPNAPQGKLPDLAAPTAYRLDLTVIPEQARFSGHAEVDLTLKHAAPSLYMHGRDLKMRKATATVGGKTFPVTFTQVTPTGAARVDFGRTVDAGQVTLKFDYDAAFASDPAGLYHVKVADDWYSWSQFESIDARSAFPSFDEPGFKTPFTVTLTTKKGYFATSNAQETGTRPVGALVKHLFAPTKPLPTYLVAFVVGPFLTAETMVPPTPQRQVPLPVRIVATKAQAGKLDFALKETGPIVTLLEKYFDQPFPFPKLDQIASPVMPGAMENAGADIYGDDILLLDADAPTTQKQEFGMVVAHELSHQWFGDLVTPAWWDDIWLNESFANWMGYRIGNEWKPELNIGTNAIGEALDAMPTDALKVGRPIHEHITQDSAVDSAFDNITYGKGGQVVAMIAAYLGDEKFKEGVRLHMRRHAYGNASTDDFWDSLAAGAHDPRVLASLKSFVDQQGVPVVRFASTSGEALAVTQAPYAYLGTEPGTQQWQIPICVRRTDARSCTMLEGKQGTIAAPGTGALIPNAGGAGYYRFELDPAGWAAIDQAAPTLPPGEALAATDSLWASFYAGKSSLPQLIAEARAMAANPDSNVAVDGGQRLAGLESRGMISDAALPAYRQVLTSIYRPLLDKLGFDPRAGAYSTDDPDKQKLRQSVVALLSGPGQDASVRAKLVAAADRYLAGDVKALDPSFLELAFAAAAQQKDSAFARSLVGKALGSEDPGFRQAALSGALHDNRRETALWFLNDLKDDRVRGTERIFLIASLINEPAARDAAADYLIGHFNEMASGNGIFTASRVPGFLGNLCTLAYADRVEHELGPKVAAINVGALAFSRTLERIRNCARVKEARTDEISQAFLAAQ